MALYSVSPCEISHTNFFISLVLTFKSMRGLCDVTLHFTEVNFMKAEYPRRPFATKNIINIWH